MELLNNDYLGKHKKFRTDSKKLATIFLVSALVVSIIVFWWLKLVGITVTGEAFCGLEEHTHGNNCFVTELICGFEEAMTDETTEEYSEEEIISEENETEEMTALRETKEETSIVLRLLDGFKTDTTYLMPNGIYKKVIYFLGEFSNQAPKQNDGFEQFDFLLLPFNEAYEALSFDNTKALFLKANNFLIKKLNK